MPALIALPASWSADADLKERLGRILQSDYFTTPPELQTLNSSAEVGAEATEAQPPQEVSSGESQQVSRHHYLV